MTTVIFTIIYTLIAAGTVALLGFAVSLVDRFVERLHEAEREER